MGKVKLNKKFIIILGALLVLVTAVFVWQITRKNEVVYQFSGNYTAFIQVNPKLKIDYEVICIYKDKELLKYSCDQTKITAVEFLDNETKENFVIKDFLNKDLISFFDEVGKNIALNNLEAKIFTNWLEFESYLTQNSKLLTKSWNFSFFIKDTTELNEILNGVRAGTWKDKYTVVFDSNGGSNIPNQEVENGEKIIRPDQPVRNGYTFVQWQLNDKEFDFNTKIIADITLIALWKANPPPSTPRPKTDNAQVVNPANHNYTNPTTNQPMLPGNKTLLEAVALGSAYYSVGLDLLKSEAVNPCFLYRFSDPIEFSPFQRNAINRGKNLLCNQYSNMIRGVETVIRTVEESRGLGINVNENEIICGWFNGGFSNVINITSHRICLNSYVLYHEMGHMLNYRWAFIHCNSCLIPGVALFNHSNVRNWTERIIEEAANRFREELGEMNELNQRIFDQAYTPTPYATSSPLERFAEMFARDMTNIEQGRSRNRLDVLLFDSLGRG